MTDNIKSDTIQELAPFVDLNLELMPKDMCLYSTTTKKNLIELISIRGLL